MLNSGYVDTLEGTWLIEDTNAGQQTRRSSCHADGDVQCRVTFPDAQVVLLT